MSWNFAGILTDIKGQIGGSFGTNDTNFLKDLINRKFDELALMFPIEELKSNCFIQTIEDYSTGTVEVTEGSKDITFTTSVLTYDMKGRKIRFEDDSSYYTLQDVDTVALTATLDKAYVGTTNTEATFTIFENNFNLPIDVNWIKGVFDFANENQQVDEKDWDYIQSIDLSLDDTGTVEYYALVGKQRILEPVSGTNTAEAGTSTSQIVDSNLIATSDNYYKDWILINTTRGNTVRVSGYTAATNTLTLEESISGQTTGDTYFLQSDFNQITFYRRPTEIKNLLVVYYKKQPLLVNDYDIPLVPDDFKGWIINSVIEIWHSKDRDAQGNATAMFFLFSSQRKEAESTLKRKYANKLDESVKEGVRVRSGRKITFNIQEQ